MFPKIASGFTAIQLLAACCAFADEPPGMPPAGAKALSATELRSLLQRVTADGRLFDDGYDKGLTFAFRPDGHMAVTSRYVPNKAVAGSWRVDAAGARLCTRIESDAENCARVYRLPTQTEAYYVDAEGGTQQANTFNLR